MHRLAAIKPVAHNLKEQRNRIWDQKRQFSELLGTFHFPLVPFVHLYVLIQGGASYCEYY